MTGAVGSLVGAVSLRLRGDYLAMVTLAFAEIVRNLAISLDRPVNLTGGVNGILNLDIPAIGGFEFREMGAYYYLIWGLALGILAALSRLRRSRIGRAWLAIREDEVAAGNMGVPVFGYKLLAFAASAVLAGMAGGVFAAWQGSVFPESFTIQQTAILYAMLVVSGAAGMPGIVVGAAALTILPEWLRDYGVYRMLLFGALLVLVMRYRPQGFFAAVPRRSAAPPAGAGAGPGAGGLMALLEVRGLTKRFGGLTAVAGVDLTVETGEIVSVIGPNGAGKTTLFELVSGNLRPDAGGVRFRDVDLVGRPPHAIARLGLVRTFQASRVFANLTVLENVLVGAHGRIRYGSSARSCGRPPSRGRKRRPARPPSRPWSCSAAASCRGPTTSSSRSRSRTAGGRRSPAHSRRRPRCSCSTSLRRA